MSKFCIIVSSERTLGKCVGDDLLQMGLHLVCLANENVWYFFAPFSQYF